MRKLNRRGVKAFAVLSFMAFTSCAIAGRGAFHLFTPPPAICRTHDAAHNQGREVAPLMRHQQDHAHLSTMWPSVDICGVQKQKRKQWL